MTNNNLFATVSSINLFVTRHFCSINHRNIGTLYFLFGALSGVIGTALSLFTRFEFLAPENYFLLGSNQLYNVLVTVYAFVMIFFMVRPVMLGTSHVISNCLDFFAVWNFIVSVWSMASIVASIGFFLLVLHMLTNPAFSLRSGTWKAKRNCTLMATFLGFPLVFLLISYSLLMMAIVDWQNGCYEKILFLCFYSFLAYVLASFFNAHGNLKAGREPVFSWHDGPAFTPRQFLAHYRDSYKDTEVIKTDFPYEVTVLFYGTYPWHPDNSGFIVLLGVYVWWAVRAILRAAYRAFRRWVAHRWK